MFHHIDIVYKHINRVYFIQEVRSSRCNSKSRSSLIVHKVSRRQLLHKVIRRKLSKGGIWLVVELGHTERHTHMKT